MLGSLPQVRIVKPTSGWRESFATIILDPHVYEEAW